MTRTALFLVLLATLGGQVGCGAGLTVSVDIYNGAMRKLQYAQNLIAIADAVSAGTSSTCNKVESITSQNKGTTTKDEQTANWSEFSDRIAVQLAPGSRSILNELEAESQKAVIDSFSGVCNQRKAISESRQVLAAYIDTINQGEAYLATTLESKLSALESALAMLRNASIDFENKTKQIKRKGNDNSLNLSIDWGRLTGQGVAVAGSASTENNVVGYPIFDRLIPMIASDRGKGSWVNYSKNRFTAVGGDAQFVVVRDGLVVFHQKSLDFDPTPVVGAGTAVARLGLKVAAAIAAGMSGGAAGSLGNLLGGSGSKPSDSGSGSTDPETKRQILQQREAAKLMLLQDLADLCRRTPAGASGPELAKLRQQLQGLINHYEASLALPATP